MNLIDSFHTKRRKGAEPNVEREAHDFDTTDGERFENLRCKVQAGCGRGHRATFAGKDRLVALAVCRFIVAADVGRQGDVADAVKDGEKIVHWFEAQHALAELASFENLGFKRNAAIGRGENKDLADGDLPTRTNEGAPEIFTS
jgi:hypothetical protein